MKRHTTDLEKLLIENGYKLVSKEYCGKYSQKIATYSYEKVVENDKYCIKLDKKRTKIVNCYLNGFSFKEIKEMFMKASDLAVKCDTLNWELEKTTNE